MFELIAVTINKMRHTKKESADKAIMREWAIPPFTSSAYSVAANANTVKGNE